MAKDAFSEARDLAKKLMRLRAERERLLEDAPERVRNWALEHERELLKEHLKEEGVLP